MFSHEMGIVEQLDNKFSKDNAQQLGKHEQRVSNSSTNFLHISTHVVCPFPWVFCPLPPVSSILWPFPVCQQCTADRQHDQARLWSGDTQDLWMRHSPFPGLQPSICQCWKCVIITRNTNVSTNCVKSGLPCQIKTTVYCLPIWPTRIFRILVTNIMKHFPEMFEMVSYITKRQ